MEMPCTLCVYGVARGRERDVTCMVVGEKVNVWRSGQLSRVNAELNEGLLSSKVDDNIWLASSSV